MSPFLIKYVAIWVTFCLVAAAILVWDRKRLVPEWREYWRFLIVPWKLWLFVPAFLFVTFAGRFTNDEPWDVVTGSGMAILTFLMEIEEGRRGGSALSRQEGLSATGLVSKGGCYRSSGICARIATGCGNGRSP